MSSSIWNNDGKVHIRQYNKMTHMNKTDVLIVGGGLCGVLCAYFLKEAGVKCVLLEGNRIGGGTIQNSMARITSQHGLIYSKLIQLYGKEKARMYLQANELAIAKYREIASHIDCDFEETSSYVYSRTDRQRIEEEISAVNSLGMRAEFAENLELPFETAGAIRFSNQAQMNPVKFLDGIVKELDEYEDLDIYEGMKVDDWISGTAWSGLYVTVANKIICATHFPYYNKKGKYCNKLYQKRSYMLALEKAPQLHGMYTDEAEDGLSFRSYGDYLIIGGEGHRTGKPGGGWDALREKTFKYYPQAKEYSHWAVQDCMSLDGVPYIGPYSEETQNFYVASGFNGWGMTSAMVSAMLLTDAILKGEGKEPGATASYSWGEVFYPGRKILLSPYLSNMKESILGKLTPGLKRCTHRGCALKWNSEEHSWDCPCHGSRFREDGKPIDNPAIENSELEPFSRENRKKRADERRRKRNDPFA